MNKYYVSLVKDLLGYYLEFEAESKEDILRYLEREYYHAQSCTWKIPWCAIYDETGMKKNNQYGPTHIISRGRI